MKISCRILRHPLDPRDAAKWKQRDIRRANPAPPRGEGMAKFMQQHAEKHEAHEDDHIHRLIRAAGLKALGPEPREQQEKCDMDPDFSSGDSTQTECPTHYPTPVVHAAPEVNAGRFWDESV